MTAEVAILNKLGVALAADSTVSIGDKTYHSANKLFSLSKHHPVGILVYNTMELNSVPLEILIKGFREQLKDRSHETLQAYSAEFIKFLTTKMPVGEEEERENVAMLVGDICSKITDDLTDKCDDNSIDLDDPDKLADVKNILDGILKRLDARATKAKRYPGFTAADIRKISSKYLPLIQMRAKRSFRRYEIDSAKLKDIENLIVKVIGSNLFSRDHSGFVIAGYGESEHYPSMIHKRSDGFIVGKLKMVDVMDVAITNKNRAIICPFAQTDVAQLFVEGVASSYQKFIERGVSDILSGLAETTAKFFGAKDAKKIALLRKTLLAKAKTFSAGLRDRRFSEFVKPMVDAVRHLDKAELAMLAEDLVSITALKQKISLDIETVGGPIDVAVISKGDGFIWIKRKHYFETSLNPIFAQKYLSRSNSPTAYRTMRKGKI
jgi:hypothetical protein